MLIYMTHPKHGIHIAYSDQEVEYNKKNGWKVFGETHPNEVQTNEVQKPKKRGRPRKEE